VISIIEGQVREKNSGEVVIMAGGVGFSMACSMNTLTALPSVGETATVHTILSMSTQNNTIDLYGFATREEKRLFQQLTSISGVGPKAALAILGSMPLRDLNLAILLGDITALSRAPGVGKKTAQRIALELKDKISQADVDASVSAGSIPVAAMSADNVAEALEALTALGYSGVEARNALSQVKDPTLPPDELIRLALRSMAGM